MIQLQNVTKKFGQIVAVDNVSLEIGRGEIVGLLGPNGAGKTTTLRLITGYLEPTEGKIIVDKFPAGTIAAKNLIGYLPENNPLYTEMKVGEYLEMVREVRGVGDVGKLGDVGEECGIVEVMGREIGELSRGYRQRTGLAAALLANPAVLIMDEPTSGLDPNQQEEMHGLLKGFGKEKTVILSTHILSEVEKICDRVIIINRGKIVADEPLKKIKNLEKLFRELTRE